MRLLPAIAAGFLACAASAVPALAQTAFIQHNPPFTIKGGDKKGFCIELVDEMAKLVGKAVTYVFMDDWKEAQIKAANTVDGMVFPLIRTPEREPNYNWLQVMFDLKASFVTKPGGPAVNSFDDAKALPTIGLVAGSLWSNELAKRGVTNIKPLANYDVITAALASGEITAAYGPQFALKYGWRTGGYAGEPVFGESLQKLDMYIVTSKNAPSIVSADWQSAFEAVQQDGTFDRIYESYFGKR